MKKIFISHAEADNHLAIKLMDMLQSQFNLKRDNFFLTSDEELEIGSNWIEDIRIGMEEANIIMPLITPNFMESQFCLCELGAAWVNEKALVPIIIPPLDHNALANTPYRSWVQSITLNTIKDLQRLAEAMINKGVGTVHIVRFNTRAEDFYEEILIPFIKDMEQREAITPTAFTRLKGERDSYKEAYIETEKELKALNIENNQLRKMKDSEEVKAFDFSKMNEWETFTDAIQKAELELNALPRLIPSILYNDISESSYGGFFGEREDNPTLKKLASEGYIFWDDGYRPDNEHPAIQRAEQALSELTRVIYDNGDILQERFETEYKDLRMSLKFSPFWEKVLNQKIQHSS